MREAQDRLLDGADAVLVKPAAAPSAPAAAGSSPDKAIDKATVRTRSKGKSKRRREVPAAPSGALDRPDRWAVLAYVDGLLGTRSLPLLHNLVAVPVTALLAGWLGWR